MGNTQAALYRLQSYETAPQSDDSQVETPPQLIEPPSQVGITIFEELGDLKTQLNINQEQLKVISEQNKKDMEQLVSYIKSLHANLEYLNVKLHAIGTFPSAGNLELQEIKEKFQASAPILKAIPISPDEHERYKKYETIFKLQGYVLTEHRIEIAP